VSPIIGDFVNEPGPPCAATSQMPARLMTRAAFEWWVNVNAIDVVIAKPHLEQCDCGDINCHGWRFVACRAIP